MSYPTLPTDQLDASERFQLTSADREVVRRGRNNPQRLGLAVLLKVYQALGYVPSKGMIPREIVQRLAGRIAGRRLPVAGCRLSVPAAGRSTSPTCTLSDELRDWALGKPTKS